MIDIDELEPEDAAAQWFEDNRDVWEAWVQ